MMCFKAVLHLQEIAKKSWELEDITDLKECFEFNNAGIRPVELVGLDSHKLNAMKQVVYI